MAPETCLHTSLPAPGGVEDLTAPTLGTALRLPLTYTAPLYEFHRCPLWLAKGPLVRRKSFLSFKGQTQPCTRRPPDQWGPSWSAPLRPSLCTLHTLPGPEFPASRLMWSSC